MMLSEDLYSTFFNNCLDAIFITSPDGSIFYANPAACTMLGWSEEEICQMGRNGIVVQTPQLEIDIGTRKEKGSFFGEVFFIRKDKTIIPVEISSSIYTDDSGRVLSTIIARDKTERIRTEKALKQSENRYRNLVESSPNGIAIYQDGVFVYANRAALTIMGCNSESELIGKPVLSIVHPDSFEKVVHRMAIVAKGKSVPAIEEKLIRQDGTAFVAEVTAIATIFNDRPAGQVIVNDITERKRIENDLTRANEYNRSLLEASIDPLVTISPDGVIMDVNLATQISTGCKKDELIGTDFSNYFTDPEKARFGYKKVFSEGFVTDFELELKSKDGTKIPVLYNASLYRDRKGVVKGVFAAARDISDLKRTEEKLKRSAYELRQLSRHLEDVSETERKQISHDLHDDLGQKLTAIKMDIAWLKLRIGVQSMAVETKWTQLSKNLDDSLESVRKIAYGLRPSILDDLGLTSAIEWQLEEFRRVSGIDYKFTCKPRDIKIDSKISLTIFRILQESITNIARHSKATKVKVAIRYDAKQIKLDIIDDGIGISNDKVESNQSFGLIGMKERARTYNGELVVSGGKEGGTRVSLSIPLD